jgi:alkanesulfonate monooxygenase SsuD/methylene tetrahydromethanopterin reductase-like flavin-dependent oxidoreductase (luciferase family)
MRYGLFMQPSHPPSRSVAEGIEQDLRIIEWCDQLGFHEVWVGEHLAAPWEPYPACDLILAQAIPRTDRIVLCAGAYVVPFYHPAALALRIAQLDHMAQGRFICGIAAGSIATDFALLGVDAAAGQQRDMMREAVEIILRMWAEPDSEWVYNGRHWTVTNPAPFLAFRSHMRPFQQPRPPIGIAGLSPRSDSIRFAGENGFLPLSLTFNAEYLRDHWKVMEEGAASAGRGCDRQDWRVIRDVFVADTDAEAKAWVRSSLWAGMWLEQNLPLLAAFDWLPFIKHDPAVADADVDIDYLIDNLWLVGSPETVTQKLVDTYEVLGGFGTVVVNKYDYGDTPVAYRRSLALLATEVMPAVNRRLDARAAPTTARP